MVGKRFLDKDLRCFWALGIDFLFFDGTFCDLRDTSGARVLYVLHASVYQVLVSHVSYGGIYVFVNFDRCV